jgi:membrane dipeptidase
MNRAGVIVDCSHTGRRATLEMMERSEAPVIFSHSNPAALWPHFRNIDDDQIRACAATGGVIGIYGVNWFLGVSQPSADAIVRAVEHVGSLVGFAHVGLGLDYLFDPTEAEGVIAAWPQLAEERLGEVAVTGPSVLPEVARQLEAHGHDTETIGAIMGGNFLRVASEVWSVSAQHEDGT